MSYTDNWNFGWRSVLVTALLFLGSPVIWFVLMVIWTELRTFPPSIIDFDPVSVPVQASRPFFFTDDSELKWSAVLGDREASALLADVRLMRPSPNDSFCVALSGNEWYLVSGPDARATYIGERPSPRKQASTAADRNVYAFSWSDFEWTADSRVLYALGSRRAGDGGAESSVDVTLFAFETRDLERRTLRSAISASMLLGVSDSGALLSAGPNERLRLSLTPPYDISPIDGQEASGEFFREVQTDVLAQHGVRFGHARYEEMHYVTGVSVRDTLRMRFTPGGDPDGKISWVNTHDATILPGGDWCILRVRTKQHRGILAFDLVHPRYVAVRKDVWVE